MLILEVQQAKALLLAYLASDSVDGMLKVSFADCEAYEALDYDMVVTRIYPGSKEIEVYETIEEFAATYDLMKEYGKFHLMMQ